MAATTTTSLGGGADDRVLATAHQILKSLKAPKEDREDMLLIFSSFDNRLSGITDLINGDDSKSSEDEELDRFEAAEKIILDDSSTYSESSRQSTSLFDPPNDPVEYFLAVDEIIQWIEHFSISPPDHSTEKTDRIILDRAESAIQLAMSRLEDEFRHVLICNTIPPNAVSRCNTNRRSSLSFSSQDGGIDDNSGSFGEVSDAGSNRFHERGVSIGDDLFVDLVRPESILNLKDIIDRMVRSGYERECLQVYSSVRRDALIECLTILGVEKMSIEEVQKVEWKSLDEKMRHWVQAVKAVVGILLSGEKRLCDSLFGEFYDLKDTCFNETAKACVMMLLNFGEAVAICKRSPEKLFRILDMYEALRDALPDLEEMVLDDLVITEAKGVLKGLGEAVKGTFAEFENCIRNETSRKPVITGDVHPLPRYVMNYLKLLVDYSDTMDSLLEITEEALYHFTNDLGGEVSQLEDLSPLGRQILLLMSELEHNLGEKAKLYEDIALQQVFLMNNLYYLVRKVKDSELKDVLREKWIRKRSVKVRQYSTGYLRVSWSKALSCLKDEGIGGSSNSASKMALKERFKNFNACFEEIYRVQTGWKVPDVQLREEMRISISERVIPAYRSFVGRFSCQLEGRHSSKYIKYSPEDLETFLSDLFEGSPAVLHHIRRKSS
ncbi:exocyst complex component EXO70B1-like [Vicia villosa]|uniref:exocyst complex component EXO70B1-like n=1 Tax=Vicia villosa TaxID=3911 RepID=UPI00273AEA41|nr:exocyst complex component EXO70B1-like [Vicia villosa]